MWLVLIFSIVLSALAFLDWDAIIKEARARRRAKRRGDHAVFIERRYRWKRLEDFWKVVGYIGFTLSLIFAGSPLGSVGIFIHGIIKVLIDEGTLDDKIIQIQNLVVALCQQ